MADDIPVDPARGDGNRHAHTRRVLRVVLVAGLAAAMLVFIYVLGDIFAPVFAALALAYMLDPLVRRLERRGWPRRRAVIAIFAAAAFVIVALLAGSVPFLVRDVSYAVSAASAHLEEAGGEGGRPAEAGGDDFSSKFERSLRRSETMRRILDWAEEQHVMERAYTWLQDNARLVAERAFSAAQEGIAFVFHLGWLGFMVLLFPVYLYFFMVGLGEIESKSLALLPAPWRPRAERIAHELGVTLAAFFRGRLVVALAIAVFTSVGFAVVGLRFGVMFGLAIGISSLIPFVNVVFLVPALVIALVQFQSFGWMAVVFAVYAAGQGLDPLLTPFLLSRRTGLHPVTIIVSLLVWGRLLGVVGLLLAVPLTAAVKILGRELVMPVLAEGHASAEAQEADT